MRYQEFADRFKLACLKANMPQPQNALGKKLGVSGAMIHNYRNGLKLPSSDRLGHIAKKLHVTIDFLINGEETPTLSIKEQKLIDNYREAPEEAKSYIYTVSEREANYATLKPDTTDTQIDANIADILHDALDKLKFAHPENSEDYIEADKQLERFFNTAQQDQDIDQDNIIKNK